MEMTTQSTDISKFHPNRSVWQEGHEIDWNDVEILNTARDLQERKVKESLYIRMALKTCLMNRDEGRELPLLWLRTLTGQYAYHVPSGVSHVVTGDLSISILLTILTMWV